MNDSKTLEILESNPPQVVDWSGITKIGINIDKENTTAQPRLNEINELLQKCPNPKNILSFSVGYDSKLAKLPLLNAFNNIKIVFLGSKIKLYDEVHHLSKLERLILMNYKYPNLDDFQKLELSYLRLIRGSIENLDISAEEVFLQTCNKLKSLKGASINKLTLESCHQVDLSTIKNMHTLESLKLLGCNSVNNINYVSQCDKLKHLVITNTSLRAIDFSPLRNAKSLKTLFLDSRLPRELKAAAQSNNEVMVTNGSVVYWRDGEHPIEVYWNFEAN